MSKINKRNMKLPYKQYYKTFYGSISDMAYIIFNILERKKNLIPTQSKNQDNVE